jgi:hypothetical protein
MYEILTFSKVSLVPEAPLTAATKVGATLTATKEQPGGGVAPVLAMGTWAVTVP